jgi:hypothetical protein
VDALADQALIAFLKVHMALQRDKKIRAICQDPRLQPGYRPKPHPHVIAVKQPQHVRLAMPCPITRNKYGRLLFT